MEDAIIQDVVIARQKAEDEFLAAMKAKSPLSDMSETLVREGFLAGFYEAYTRLNELNKVSRRIKRRQLKEKRVS